MSTACNVLFPSSGIRSLVGSSQGMTILVSHRGAAVGRHRALSRLSYIAGVKVCGDASCISLSGLLTSKLSIAARYTFVMADGRSYKPAVRYLQWISPHIAKCCAHENGQYARRTVLRQAISLTALAGLGDDVDTSTKSTASLDVISAASLCRKH